MLLTSASQHFLAGSNQTCASLLAAALQYAPRICKARTAELLAATHLKLGNSNRALEYLEIARAHRAGDVITSMSALVEMGAAFASENVAQSQQGKKDLKKKNPVPFLFSAFQSLPFFFISIAYISLYL